MTRELGFIVTCTCTATTYGHAQIQPLIRPLHTDPTHLVWALYHCLSANWVFHPSWLPIWLHIISDPVPRKCLGPFHTLGAEAKNRHMNLWSQQCNPPVFIRAIVLWMWPQQEEMKVWTKTPVDKWLELLVVGIYDRFEEYFVFILGTFFPLFKF